MELMHEHHGWQRMPDGCYQRKAQKHLNKLNGGEKSAATKKRGEGTMLKAIWVDEKDEAILAHALNHYSNTMEKVNSEWPGYTPTEYMLSLRTLYNRIKRGRINGKSL